MKQLTNFSITPLRPKLIKKTSKNSPINQFGMPKKSTPKPQAKLKHPSL